jgi:hypothetical protein
MVGSVLLGLATASLPVFAVDFEYFKSQSCPELAKELAVMQKAEKLINDKIKNANSKADTQAVITTLLIGWPFWGNTDHGDSNNQLAEIRMDIKYVTRAQKTNKCT